MTLSEKAIDYDLLIGGVAAVGADDLILRFSNVLWEAVVAICVASGPPYGW